MTTNKPGPAKRAAVIGAGFAGVEAAKLLARNGVGVTLYEMKPARFSPAHRNANFCEVVCSNSFKAERLNSAAGLLKAEMARLGSLTVPCAYRTRVPAGGALAVDRDEFSALVTDAIRSDGNVTVINEEVARLPEGYDVIIIAAGPLVSDRLAATISDLTGSFLAFYDAAAPIVDADSVDMSRAFAASRYERGGEDDYINCPMDRDEYEAFIDALTAAERALVHDFDKTEIYEGCMPIEVLASRGRDAARYGPLKPVGLTDPRTGRRPWANLQLRRENAAGTMYNLVGFQTNLKFSEQKRVFGMIPALKNAEYERYGVMHRNSFLNSPALLDAGCVLRSDRRVLFAGQITGTEGYMESAASGIVAGLNALALLRGEESVWLPETTMIGALQRRVSCSDAKRYQPMGAAFGLLEPLETKIRDKSERYMKLAERALAALDGFVSERLSDVDLTSELTGGEPDE